jgi:hypothetical protein
MLAHCKAAAEMHKLEKELTGAEPFLVVVVAEIFSREWLLVAYSSRGS